MLGIIFSGDIVRRQDSNEPKSPIKESSIGDNLIESSPDAHTLDFVIEKLKSQGYRSFTRVKKLKPMDLSVRVAEMEAPLPSPLSLPTPSSPRDLVALTPKAKSTSALPKQKQPRVIPEEVRSLFPSLRDQDEVDNFMNPEKNLGDYEAVSRVNAIDARCFLLNKMSAAREVFGMLQHGNPFRTPKIAYQALLIFLQMDTFIKAAPYLLNNSDDERFSSEERALILGFARLFSKMDLAHIQKAFSSQPFLGLSDQDLEDLLPMISVNEDSRGYKYRTSYYNLTYVDKVILGLLFLQLENLSNSSEKMTEVQMKFFEELQAYYIDHSEGMFCISFWRMKEGMTGFLKDTFFSIFSQKLNLELLSESGCLERVQKLLQLKRLKNLGME